MFWKTLILAFACTAVSSEVLEVLNQWNVLDFNFPYDSKLIDMFRPENVVFTGLEIGPDRLYLAMPRLRAGVPATLAVIPRHTPPASSPRLQAYPSWDYHSIGRGDLNNCTGLISVYRMRMDRCGRLWALDSGVMTSIDNFQRICPPKIMIIDTRTNQPVRTVIFPDEVLRPASLLTNIVIDESVQGTCDHAVAYMSDTAAPGIIVYDSQKDTAWRFMHPTMYPDPDFNSYNIQGETFSLMDGIVGITHSPKLALLYYQPLATDRLFSVSTQVLRNGPLAEFEELPVKLVGRKSSQGLGICVDPRDDTVYFSPLTETAVAAWQPGTNVPRMVAFDPERLQFPAELRFAEYDNGNIWLLSTKFQKFFKRTISPSEVNLRVIRLIKNNYAPGAVPLRPSNTYLPYNIGFDNNTLSL